MNDMLCWYNFDFGIAFRPSGRVQRRVFFVRFLFLVTMSLSSRYCTTVAFTVMSRYSFTRNISYHATGTSNYNMARFGRQPPTDMTGWTVDQVLTASTLHLAAANVTEPHLSVQHLLADSLHLSWESGFRDVLNQRSTVLTAQQASDFHAKLDRRSKHEPLQYILGQWDFLDYTISIKSPLLCPRPETEELVQHIIIGHEMTQSPPIHILDVGCGTGVIGLALAKQFFPNAFVQAIDIDPVAIETSHENSQRILGKQGLPSSSSSPSCYHYQATLCSAQDYRPDHPFDIVVSNPPYIPRADMDTLSLDVIGYENDAALCGGEDGMDVIRVIVHQLRHWCNSGAMCWMEVDPTHPRLIEKWLSQESGMLGVAFEAVYHDMFGKDRFVKLRVL